VRACRYCDKYGIDLDPRLERLIGIRPQVHWRKFSTAENMHLCNSEVRRGCEMLCYCYGCEEGERNKKGKELLQANMYLGVKA